MRTGGVYDVDFFFTSNSANINGCDSIYQMLIAA